MFPGFSRDKTNVRILRCVIYCDYLGYEYINYYATEKYAKRTADVTFLQQIVLITVNNRNHFLDKCMRNKNIF